MTLLLILLFNVVVVKLTTRERSVPRLHFPEVELGRRREWLSLSQHPMVSGAYAQIRALQSAPTAGARHWQPVAARAPPRGALGPAQRVKTQLDGHERGRAKEA